MHRHGSVPQNDAPHTRIPRPCLSCLRIIFVAVLSSPKNDAPIAKIRDSRSDYSPSMPHLMSQIKSYIHSPSGSVGNHFEERLRNALDGPEWSPLAVRPLRTKDCIGSKIPRLNPRRNQSPASVTLDDVERLLKSQLEGPQRVIEVIKDPHKRCKRAK
jgi:hypothetical protein